MGLRTSFDRLSTVIEQYDRGGRSVRNVEARSDDDGRLHATLEVPVSLCAAESEELRPAVSPMQATLTDDGSLRVEFTTPETAALPEAVTVEDRTVSVTDGGDILIHVSVIVGAPTADDSTGDESVVDDSAGNDSVAGDEANGGDTAATTVSDHTTDCRRDVVTTDSGEESGPAVVRDESVPAYEDTAYLQQLYETCDTFSEMSREIEMDVAGETVRRYMIDAGVHEPSSYETADDESERDCEPKRDGGAGTAVDESVETDRAAAVKRAESASGAGGGESELESMPVETSVDSRVSDPPDEQFVTDGIGLPDGVEIEDIAEAVTASSTVYDVQRQLGLEGEQTWELLQQLDLLELLVGRLSDGQERGISYESVTGRIRQSMTNTA